jgi:hypothetical protein
MPIHGYPGNVITANPTAPTVSSASGVWTTEQQLINQAAGRWPMAQTQISRSLRFNSADSAYLNRTPASASNRTTWTWSGWVKRGSLGSVQQLFMAGAAGTDYTALFFNSTDTLCFHNVASSANAGRKFSSAVYRDPAAWYHIVAVWDTTNATAGNRMLLYVNGVQLTVFSPDENPSSSQVGQVNNNAVHTISKNSTSASQYVDGYMTEVNFIDGLALTPAYFGFNDSNTGVWTPRQYTGAYGTNGFYVNFSDNSNTTAATLGKDYSGNGNNWTPNNFSVTAGAGNDSLVDSPTSYGTDTGAGGEVRGNYAVLNPVDKSSSITVSNGALSATAVGFPLNILSSIAFPVSGKFYAEISSSTATNGTIGIGFGVQSPAAGVSADYNATGAYKFYASAFPYIVNNGSITSISSGYTNSADQTFKIAADVDSGKVWLGQNATWWDSSGGTTGNPTTGANPTFTVAIAGYFVVAHFNSGVSFTWTANFGQRAFAYTAPSGFKALCTQNLPTPTIGATSTTQANDYMNVVLYTGNGSTQSITGVGFQPDLVWLKARSAAYGHGLFDVLRGTTKRLSSDGTGAEGTESGVTSFDSDGFTMGSATFGNNNGTTMVGWNWKANGAGSSNTAGSITSTVSANTTSGFSIVTATLGAAGVQGTVGHGLGVAPSMIIFKTRSGATYNWSIYHASVCDTTSKYFRFTTDALQTYSTTWGAALPTSTVFGVTGDGCGSPSNPFVAYCFAPVTGYSAFGSYTGNGSTDGPFVYLGFRPAYVMIKYSSGTADWIVLDKSRPGYNVIGGNLYPNGSYAEDTQTKLDFTSNGFKIRADGSNANVNVSSGTYIYAAFAEFPFKTALAR